MRTIFATATFVLAYHRDIVVSGDAIAAITGATKAACHLSAANAVTAYLAGAPIALTGTWTWDGTPTVLSDDTSQIRAGRRIRKDAGSRYLEVLEVDDDVSVTVDDALIPSGAGAEMETLTPTGALRLQDVKDAAASIISALGG